MDTRKYSSPLGGDISLNKAAKGRGWKGLKGQMALALAVSLWIGSSGVAMAQEIVVDEDLGNGVSGNTAYPNDKTQWYSVGSTTPNPNNNKVTVNAGVTVDGFIKGSFDNNNNVTGNEVIVNGTVNYFVSGGQSYYANAQNNIVTINGTVVGGDEGVYGGFTVAGSASGNRVTINGTVNKDVYGGHGNNGATGNFVTVNGKVDGNVYGGGFIFNPATGNMTDNDITLNGATVGGSVYGGYKSTGDVVTGNTLNLSGANTAGAVQNFATININSATWGTPVLTAKIMQNTGGSYATIDASNLAFTETTDKNIMGQSTTLLKGANLTNNILNQPAAGKGLVSIAGYTDAKGVKFDATASGAISVDSAKDLIYTINKVDTSKITLGSFAWGDTDAMPTGWTASGTTQIDAANLSFKNPESVTGTQTLLAANAELAEIGATEKNMSYSYVPVAGVTMDGKILGSYASSGGNLTYTATANQATKLTFGNVAWKDTGALMTRPSNITFNGAAVDTSNIYFTNIKSIEDNKQMTLVSDFGTSVGTISGTSFGIGTEKGEGHAFYENNNLRYLVTKGIGNSQASSTESVSGQTETVGNEAKVNFSVIGAMTGSGRAESNKATVSDKSEVTGNVVGAETTSGVVDKNEANVIGNSQINGNVEAAKTNSGSATANTANVESSKVTGSTVGAVTDNGLAIGNVASVTSGSVGTDVAGAQSTSGTVSNGNTAKVQSAEVGGSVYGGKSTSGEVNSSIANVSGGSVKGSVYGGSTDGAQKAEKNEVKLENDAKVQKDVYGGYSAQGTATGNTVTVEGATVDGTVYGGKSKDKSDNNSVELDNGTVGAIVGGGCEEASGNIVTITGGEVLNGVYGAKAGSSATNNTITMSGGTVNNVLYGGYADSATGITTGNTVTLYGTADVSNAGVFGGNGSDITGNVLNIGTIINDVAHNWSGGGQSVKNVANFETMNFVSVPWNKEKAAVTISDGTASDLSATKVNATTVHFTDTTSLKQGDTMTLLDEQKVAVDKRVQAGNITKESEYTAGSTLKGTGILSMDDSGNVIYKVTDKDSSDQSHNTVMGVTASMAALSAGNDFVGSAVEGLGNSNNAGSDGLSTYANLGGGSMNVETGSHVKTHTWNAILAIGHKNEKKLSTTEYGAFFEYGTGNYSTFNGDERGDGSTRYTGGGILGKWQKNNGFYVEGSLRAGSIHDDAHNVLRDANGNPYSYTTDATYWGAHIGVGREIKLNKTAVLDLYAKYFYNHRGSVSFDAGGHYDLGAVESSVLRVGTRYTVKQNDNINYYGGLAVEHEFCGRASGFADGVAIRGADISGTSVRGEIGATFRPGEKSNVTLDLNLSGFAGKKQGFTGGLSAVFHI